MITAEELYRLAGIVPNGTTSWDDDKGVPSKLPGVYVISVTKNPTKFKDPSGSASVRFWLPDQKIVYIGRTRCKGGLNKRLRQFRKHVYGDHSRASRWPGTPASRLPKDHSMGRGS